MLQQILADLKPTNTQLVAVSKTKPVEHILEIYEEGQRIFGENKVLELRDKYEEMPKDIQWHFIGHLQTNKVKYIASFVHLIHGVDSLKLLKAINKQAAKNDRIIDCLLQFHIAEEATKFGLDLDAAFDLLKTSDYGTLSNIRLVGVMGMATFTNDKEQVQREFKTLKSIFDALKKAFFLEDTAFKEISMGMSGDYQLAVEEGSTMVRVGSLIFGNRVYSK